MIVDQLKTSILDSAFKGKLTQQNETEANVAKFLKVYNKDLPKIFELNNESLPKNWIKAKLGNISTLISGQDLTSDRYFETKKPNSLPYLTGASNILSGKLVLNRYTLTPTSIAQTGDILLTCKGTIGETLILDIEKVHIARQFMAIRTNDINSHYILYYLKYIVPYLMMSAKSIIPGIDRKLLLNIEIPLPPLEEQQRIVDKIEEMFSILDETRPIEEELKKLKIKFSDVIKKSILMHYTHSNKNEKIRMEKIVNVKTGKKNANYGSENGKYLFFTCARDPIRADGFSFDSEAILLAGNGDISNINYYVGKFEAYQRTYVLTNIDTKKMNMKYLYYHLRASWVEYNNYQIYGSAIPYIKLDNLKKYFVHCPSIEEQNRIVEKIEELLPLCDDIDSVVNS